MKTIADAAMAAIEAGEAIVAGAAKIVPRDPLLDPIFVWGGYGVLNIDGDDYLPLGDRAFAQQTSLEIGGVAQGMTMGVSGVEPNALSLLDVEEVKRASVVVTRLIFDSSGRNLLDAHVFDRGRGDALNTVETIGGQAAIQYAVESAARSLGRSGARMRADSDQRLIDVTDGYFKFTAYAGEKMLYWGGKKPARAGSTLSVSPPSGSFGT